MDKADEADRALNAFVSGRMPFERLIAALKSLVLGDGTALPVLARLESWANEGRLPPDLAALLAGEIGGSSAAAAPGDAGLDPPTVPLAPPRPAMPEPTIALPPASAIRDKVDEVVVNALIGDFVGLRGRNRSGEARSDPTLDASLADFRSLRFRRDASNAEAGRARRFELDPRRETRQIGIGAMLKDRFILDAEIGRGGMGTVYRAVDRRRLEAMRHQPYVALKLLGGDFRHHPEALRTIEAEARRAQELAHPNIVTIHDFERDGGHLFIVMELLEGEPLDQRIARAGATAVGWEEGREILEGLCAGLAHAHTRSVVHADIKPANVFLTAGGVKLLDFGIASAARDGGFDPTSLGGLTIAYASPQMIETTERRADDDVYALGCITYELLAGRHPFDGKAAIEAREEGLSPVRPGDVEDKLWLAVTTALAFEREQRPVDAGAFAKVLFG